MGVTKAVSIGEPLVRSNQFLKLGIGELLVLVRKRDVMAVLIVVCKSDACHVRELVVPINIIKDNEDSHMVGIGPKKYE